MTKFIQRFLVWIYVVREIQDPTYYGYFKEKKREMVRWNPLTFLIVFLFAIGSFFFAGAVSFCEIFQDAYKK